MRYVPVGGAVLVIAIVLLVITGHLTVAIH